MKSNPEAKVVAFPCNQFGQQEPGSAAEIKEFVSKYGLDPNGASNFHLMAKVDVNGPGAHPVYQWLKGVTGSGDIGWNFAGKFLVRCDAEKGKCHVSQHGGRLPSELVRQPRAEL
mmetsp:Transcript_34629/g.78278  ORF Transcript_34629/g.78278 Transcript_34629/m.78278 type:complete len:115 (-) Transcript_34629:56-400(-)